MNVLNTTARHKTEGETEKNKPPQSFKMHYSQILKKQQGGMATGHLFQNQLQFLSRHMLHKEWNCQTGIDNRGIIFKYLF